MTERNYNRFDMTGSCTECTESAFASSSRSNNALLLITDTVIAVSVFVALSVIAGIIDSAALIIISAIIIILIAAIICIIIAPPEYRPNRGLEPLI